MKLHFVLKEMQGSKVVLKVCFGYRLLIAPLFGVLLIRGHCLCYSSCYFSTDTPRSRPTSWLGSCTCLFLILDLVEYGVVLDHADCNLLLSIQVFLELLLAH